MRHLDLFSGIGGFALAARWAGFETVAFCEIEEFPRKVLAKNFPGIPIHKDIRELDGGEYEGIELITGGYPCQPFSLAGKRSGKKDDRHLWPEMLRIITQARPAWVVAENVAGHLTMGLDKVLSELEAEGYSARPVIIPACAVNAPHRRDRIWIIANAGGEQYKSHSFKNKRQGTEKLSKAAMANTTRKLQHREGQARSAGRDESSNSSQWAFEPTMGRVAHGVPGRVDRLKSLGNAIVPQVVFEILKPIAMSLIDK